MDVHSTDVAVPLLSEQRNHHTLAVSGSVDASNARHFEALLDRAEQPEVLDLRGLDFFDSSGMMILERWIQRQSKSRPRVLPSRAVQLVVDALDASHLVTGQPGRSPGQQSTTTVMESVPSCHSRRTELESL